MYPLTQWIPLISSVAIGVGLILIAYDLAALTI